MPPTCKSAAIAENVESLTLEYLRRLDAKFDVMAADVREARQAISGIVQILASHDNHMLRMEERLGRIEKRLDLRDSAIPG